MERPLVLEINTRCWLEELSVTAGHTLTLATVPDAEFSAWKRRGLTHIWLMGVWATGPKTRDAARAQPELQALSREAFGTGGEQYLASSPYAIADYTAADFVGGFAALREFRKKLREFGIGLILDFVQNHVGLGPSVDRGKNLAFCAKRHGEAGDVSGRNSGRNGLGGARQGPLFSGMERYRATGPPQSGHPFGPD